MRRMALIAASVETAHVGDQRVRPLGLDLQRGNQGVLGFHHDPVALAFDIDTDGELRLHGSTLPFGAEPGFEPSKRSTSRTWIMHKMQEYLASLLRC